MRKSNLSGLVFPEFMRIVSRSLITVFVTSLLTVQAYSQQNIITSEGIVKTMKLKAKGTFLYGFKPSVSRDDVKTAMGKMEVFKEDEFEIIYTVYFSDNKYDFGDVTFAFTNGKLTTGSLETYFGTNDSAKKFLNVIKRNYEKLYGSGNYEQGTFKWSYAKKGRTLEIKLSEIVTDSDFGFVIEYTAYE